MYGNVVDRDLALSYVRIFQIPCRANLNHNCIIYKYRVVDLGILNHVFYERSVFVHALGHFYGPCIGLCIGLCINPCISLCMHRLITFLHGPSYNTYSKQSDFSLLSLCSLQH